MLTALFACGDSKQEKEDVIFFQVKQFILKELDHLKNTPYFIYKIETIDGQRDSTVIPVDTAIMYAQQFLEPDINSKELKKFYEESVFHDQTTGTYSLNYSTSNKELEVQNINVLLFDDGKTVRRLFIRKHSAQDDASVIQQLSWKPSESFEINRLIQSPNQQERTHRTMIVWNEK